MDIEFDDAKDPTNITKHGVSLALESRIGEVVDVRRDYGETRMNAFELVEGRLFACTYALRGGTRRIISVRRASSQEQHVWLS